MNRSRSVSKSKYLFAFTSASMPATTGAPADVPGRR